MDFLLGLALCMGLDAGAERVQEKIILELAIRVTISKEDWSKEVVRELARQGVDDCSLADRLTGSYYATEVHDRLLGEFEGWLHEERLWLVSEGRTGKSPSVFDRLELVERVRKIGKDLEETIKKHVEERR